MHGDTKQLCFNHISALKVHKITNLNCGMNRFKPLRFILELASRHSNETERATRASVAEKRKRHPKSPTGFHLKRVWWRKAHCHKFWRASVG
jgi:hypothetical protein